MDRFVVTDSGHPLLHVQPPFLVEGNTLRKAEKEETNTEGRR